MIHRINLRTVRLILFAVTVAVLAVLTADRADAADGEPPTECRYNGAQHVPGCVDWANVDHDGLQSQLDAIYTARSKAISAVFDGIDWGNVDWGKLDADLAHAQHEAAKAAANATGAAYCTSVAGQWAPYAAAYDDATASGGICTLASPTPSFDLAAYCAEMGAESVPQDGETPPYCWWYGYGRDQCISTRWNSPASRYGATWDLAACMKWLPEMAS